MKKLNLVKLSILSTAIVAGTAFAGGNATGSNKAQSASYVYLQTATAGQIKKDDAGSYTVTMQGVSPQTVQFTNRPLRVSNTIATGDLVKHWSVGRDSFAHNPPNAILSYTENQQLRTLDVIEVSQPKYDEAAHTISYQIKPVGKDTQLPAEANMVRPSLFIDKIFWP